MISLLITIAIVALIMSFVPIDPRITALILLLIVLFYFFGHHGGFGWRL